nr:MAG TPA: hypothetical protein [Caudoviricetes sp.]
MATYFIRNTEQLNKLVIQKISRGLLAYVSKKVVKIMQDNLSYSEISTSTLQKTVGYKINSAGDESDIAIDYEFAQTFASPPEFDGNGRLIVWGHLTNTFGSNAFDQTWNGELISFRLAEWLESGGSGTIGNQPIVASHWFTKTKQEVEMNLQSWAREYLRQNGFIK